MVFIMGISQTIRRATPLVSHKNITVNGELVNITSYSIKPGDVIGVREKSKSLEAITDSLASNSSQKYPWLEWYASALNGKVVALPVRDEILENIHEQLIVELYSK